MICYHVEIQNFNTLILKFQRHKSQEAFVERFTTLVFKVGAESFPVCLNGRNEDTKRKAGGLVILNTVSFF